MLMCLLVVECRLLRNRFFTNFCFFFQYLNSRPQNLSPAKPRRNRMISNISPHRSRQLNGGDKQSRTSQLSNLIPNELEFKTLLQNGPLRENFILYLRSTKTSAPMDLWMEIESFEGIPTDTERDRRVKYDEISAKYLKDSYTSGVTISSRTMKLLTPYDDPSIPLPPNVFNRVKDELAILLQYSSINAYMKSDIYAEFSKTSPSECPKVENFNPSVSPPPKPTRGSPLLVKSTAVNSPLKKSSDDSVRDMVRSRGAMGFLNWFTFLSLVFFSLLFLVLCSADGAEVRPSVDHRQGGSESPSSKQGESSSSTTQSVDIREMVRKKGAVGFL
jgi:hypothetical protein